MLAEISLNCLFNYLKSVLARKNSTLQTQITGKGLSYILSNKHGDILQYIVHVTVDGTLTGIGISIGKKMILKYEGAIFSPKKRVIDPDTGAEVAGKALLDDDNVFLVKVKNIF